MWNLEYDMNELIYETEIYSECFWLLAKVEGAWEGCIGSLGLVDAKFYIQSD